jgi:hypothetical protein
MTQPYLMAAADHDDPEQSESHQSRTSRSIGRAPRSQGMPSDDGTQPPSSTSTTPLQPPPPGPRRYMHALASLYPSHPIQWDLRKGGVVDEAAGPASLLAGTGLASSTAPTGMPHRVN